MHLLFFLDVYKRQLLDRPIHDVDIASSSYPEETKAIFDRTVDVGIEHGTVLVLENGQEYEITTFRTDVYKRQAQTSTGLGDGIAMPHSKNEAVKEATVLFAKSNKGVDYASLDGLSLIHISMPSKSSRVLASRLQKKT